MVNWTSGDHRLARFGAHVQFDVAQVVLDGDLEALLAYLCGPASTNPGDWAEGQRSAL